MKREERRKKKEKEERRKKKGHERENRPRAIVSDTIKVLCFSFSFSTV